MDSSSSGRIQNYEESLSSILNHPPRPPQPPPPLPPSTSSSSLFDNLPSYLPTFNNIHPANPNPAQPLSSSSSSPPPPPRPSKKRSRASRRAPTTVLTTDTANFRAMVQEFTGFPSPPFPPPFLPRTTPSSSSSSLLSINYPLSTMNIIGSGGGGRNPILAGLLQPQQFGCNILGTPAAGGPRELKDANSDGDGSGKRQKSGDAWSNIFASD